MQALQEQTTGRTQLLFRRYITQSHVAVGKIAPVGFVIPDRIDFTRQRGNCSISAITSASDTLRESIELNKAEIAKPELSCADRAMINPRRRHQAADGQTGALWQASGSRRCGQMASLLMRAVAAHTVFAGRWLLGEQVDIDHRADAWPHRALRLTQGVTTLLRFKFLH